MYGLEAAEPLHGPARHIDPEADGLALANGRHLALLILAQHVQLPPSFHQVGNHAIVHRTHCDRPLRLLLAHQSEVNVPLPRLYYPYPHLLPAFVGYREARGKSSQMLSLLYLAGSNPFAAEMLRLYGQPDLETELFGLLLEARSRNFVDKSDELHGLFGGNVGMRLYRLNFSKVLDVCIIG